MRKWTLNWGEIRDDIVVGSCPRSADDIDTLAAETGVSALLSIQHNECRAALDINYRAHKDHGVARGLTLVNAPMRDFDTDSQRHHLADAVHGLHVLLSAGHRVYVHCTAGVNRAPLTVLGYLDFVESMSPDEAMALIRAGRPGAEPDWEAFHGARADLVERHRGAILMRAWELYQQDPDTAADENWFAAEREIIRDAFWRQLPGNRAA